MSQAIYTVGEGWHDLGVVPFGPIPITPAASVLHYGQEMFEGTKAFLREDGTLWMFRPDMNLLRAKDTCFRVDLPDIPDELFMNAMVEGLKANADWIPTKPGTAMYLRPVMFASEPVIGVRAANEYMFFVLYSPTGSYYGNGQLVPSRIYVESKYSRAADGGTGYVKTSGNYAAAMRSEMDAIAKGYQQVLWTDSATHTYAEEIGTSNAFFVIDGVVITPPTSTGTILPGITRDSCLTLLHDWNVPVEERKITVQEISDAYDKGTLEEIFSTGTAAIVSPIGQLDWDDKQMIVKNQCGPVAKRLYDTLDAIRLGKAPDPHNWMYQVK